MVKLTLDDECLVIAGSDAGHFLWQIMVDQLAADEPNAFCCYEPYMALTEAICDSCGLPLRVLAKLVASELQKSDRLTSSPARKIVSGFLPKKGGKTFENRV